MFLGKAAAAWLSAACGLPALALEAPSAKVMLTLTGRVSIVNDHGAASFDLAGLQALPSTRIITSTPWHRSPRSYTGVLLRDLLIAVGNPTAALHAGALNDYQVDIPNDDVTQRGAMVAYLLDDKAMTVREKGPLMVMYPFDDRPDLRDAVHYSRAIWQLRTLELR